LQLQEFHGMYTPPWIRRLAFAGLAAWATALPSPGGGLAQSAGPQFEFPVAPVTFANGTITLSGGVLVPIGKGPFPAVVMLHGAMPTTFDEPAFRIHANAFVRAGFTVLLYDKRGSGKSGGEHNQAHLDDLPADAIAGVQFLRQRADIDPRKNGLMGRSEGGWVGTIAAGCDPDIAFVIMSSGSAVAPHGQTLFSTRNALRARGATPEEIENATAAKAAQWAYCRDVANDPAWALSEKGKAARAAVEARLKSFARFAPEIPQFVADPENRAAAFFRAFTRKIFFEPAPAFAALKVPLLEIIGDKDDVVDPVSTIAELERLRARGLKITIHVLPDVDHTLLVRNAATPRYPDDYPERAVRWAREVVDRVGPQTR
jgi:pimeloyl-ACP methyl ester carboxylesterase